MLVVCNVFSRIYYLRLSSHILSVLPHFTNFFSSRKCCCYDLKVSIFQFPPFNTDPPTICHTMLCCDDTFWIWNVYHILQEKMKGKNRLVPRLLGVTKDSVLRLDEKTKEILKTWPLTTVRRWAASPNVFTLDFGDYQDQYYSVQVTYLPTYFIVNNIAMIFAIAIIMLSPIFNIFIDCFAICSPNRQLKVNKFRNSLPVTLISFWKEERKKNISGMTAMRKKLWKRISLLLEEPSPWLVFLEVTPKNPTPQI